MDIKEIIERTSREAAEETVKAMKRNGMIKKNAQTPYQRTESLLYNYTSFIKAIKKKIEQIEEIKAIGLQKKSKSVTSYGRSGGAPYEMETEEEKISEKIKTLQESIEATKRYLKMVDKALEQIRTDQYYAIIVMRYMDKKTTEEIAESIGKDVSTINRNRKRLINQLQVLLFPDGVLHDYFLGT